MALSPDRLAAINGSDALDKLREQRRAQEVYAGLRDEKVLKGIGALADREAGLVRHDQVEDIKNEADQVATEEFEAIAFPLRREDAGEQFVIPGSAPATRDSDGQEILH